MKILVINCGSSSIKFQLFEMNNEKVLIKGLMEKIGSEKTIIKYHAKEKEEQIITDEILDHREGINKLLRLLINKENGVIQNVDEIKAVGHRVVHGGEFFSTSVIIDGNVRQAIRQTIELAPLHNPPNLLGIDAAQNQLPKAIHVAVFDTAFHQTMSESVYMYPLPRVLYQKYRIRKYGFHGTSHKYVSHRAEKFLNQSLSKLKIVSCHIGNGVSLTAIENGKSIDTSMGMTPLAGLMMGTRCGNIDPAIVPFVIAKEELTLSEIKSMMNKHSGLLGVTGLSGDVREVIETMFNGNQAAKLAIDMYVYQLRKTIGEFIAAMNGIDVLIFTAGVGENSPLIREKVCESLTFFGIQLDRQLNGSENNGERQISVNHSKVTILVIPTNEELMIAREAKELVRKEIPKS